MDKRQKLLTDRSIKYPLVVSELFMLDEYKRILYFKMLCSVAQCGELSDDMPIIRFLRRIAGGMKLERTLEEYLRMAMEITEEDLGEFVLAAKNGNYKYYFILDAILLTALAGSDPDRYAYLEKFIELVDVSEDILECLCLAAKAVIMEKSYFLDAAESENHAFMQQIDLVPYIS